MEGDQIKIRTSFGMFPEKSNEEINLIPPDKVKRSGIFNSAKKLNLASLLIEDPDELIDQNSPLPSRLRALSDAPRGLLTDIK